jgi:hypothetical protein
MSGKYYIPTNYIDWGCLSENPNAILYIRTKFR